MPNTGFDTDNFRGVRKITGLKLGTVIDRDDPEGLCRIRAKIPGEMERTPWARPRGGGAANQGKADVPPLGADVYIQFVNDDPRIPVYDRADYGVVDGKSEVFPEHTHPDIHVVGLGPFRLVVDNRDPDESGVPRTARLKMVKEVGGEEQDIVWAEISEEDNSLQIHADSALGLESGAIIDIDAPAVQIKKRKVMNTSRPIN